MSDSTIDGLYIQHTKVGLWFDGPMDNLIVRNTQICIAGPTRSSP